MIKDSMCALDTEGDVYCWGEWGRAAERAEDRIEYFVRPVQVRGLPPIRQLAPYGAPVAVSKDGELFRWALAPTGALQAKPVGKSIPSTSSLRPDGRVPVVSFDAVQEEHAQEDFLAVVEAGRYDHGDVFLCSVFSSGPIRCGAPWLPEAPTAELELPAAVKSIGGNGSDGDFIVVLEDGRTAIWGPELELVLREEPRVVQASRSQDHSCGIDQSGEVHCWREVSSGKPNRHDRPARIVNGAGPAQAVVTLRMGGCALGTANTVKCWGWNVDGECGVGTREQFVDTPTLVLAPQEGP